METGHAKLTQNGIIAAFATSHAPLATDMARKTRMDNDVLPIVIAGRVDAADDEELLIAVEGIEDGSQFVAESACQGEVSRVDSIEGQSQICSQSLIVWLYWRRILGMHTREVSHALLDSFSLVGGEKPDVWTLPIECQDPLGGCISGVICGRGLRAFPRRDGLHKGIGIG